MTDIYIDAAIDAVHLSQIACDTPPDDLMLADIDRSWYHATGYSTGTGKSEI